MRRRRRGRRGRLPIQPEISTIPEARKMIPEPSSEGEQIFLDAAEFEAIKLVDYDGMYQEQAGQIMGVSRGTIWRFLQSGRSKIVQSILEARPLVLRVDEESDNLQE
ncbi:MAG: hypothetical protein BAJATHORv1_40317 [Candidatus Thorarchaeota archaeon]|nr:MAG: hypothetical protein BAJATHORv1_40317 [Candidatus Thorarchaeota archaeon]